jgi:hypothetical protein
MERNRQRMLALGLPAIVRTLEGIAGATKPPPKKRVKKERAPRVKVKVEPLAEGEGPRRSSRIRDQELNPKIKEESVEDRWERELGEFLVDGTCPKCGNVYERGHRAHLERCTGAPRAKSDAYYRGYSQMDRELLADLTEEDKKDERKRMKARMKAVNLSDLVDFNDAAATFIVLGSRGDPYTITLADERHKCTCMDFRFRGKQRPCKHICKVLESIEKEEDPSDWRDGVEKTLDELIKLGDREGEPPMAPPPRNRAAEEASKFM